MSKKMLERLAGPFQEFGLGAGLLYMISRALQTLSPRLDLLVYELVVQPIPESSPAQERAARGIEIRQIVSGDPEVDLMPARPEIKASRFAQGAVCLGAYRQEQLLGYIWLTFGPYEEDEARCTYAPVPNDRSVFDFDLYILPRYRMGRAFGSLWAAVNGWLRDRGIEQSYSRITRFNTASRKAHARLGAQRIGLALFLQAWRVELMVATVKPYLALSGSPGRRVQLQLGPPSPR